MSKNKRTGRRTAEEILTELQRDPAYLKQIEERDRRRAERHAVAKQQILHVVSQLHSLGYTENSLEELVQHHAPLDQKLVLTLLDSLSQLTDESAIQSLIRTLAATKCSYPGQQLCRAFDATHNINLQWVIINTIALTRPEGIQEWLDNTLHNPYWRDVYTGLKNGTVHENHS